MNHRNYTLIDRALIQIDSGLTSIFGQLHAHRPNPATSIEESALTEQQKQESARLMRVNHSGEVCAQALYNAQILMARTDKVRETLEKAADEETDHLAWTHDRIKELGSHRSFLNVLWYCNAFLIGVLAGFFGDRWSLGFVEETENQVTRHLEIHLKKLPLQDNKSQKIVAQMCEDEARHGHAAESAGASELPEVVKNFMALHGKVMTTLAYWI